MTNKERYPDAKVKGSDQEYYVHLTKDGKLYITNDTGEVLDWYQKNADAVSDSKRVYFPTQQAAQTALDNFMNEKKPITLDEIKSQLSEAKKLIGKKVCPNSSSAFIVDEIILDVSGEPSSLLCDNFFNKNGYVIKVCGNQGGTKVPYTADLKPVSVVEITNHRGEKYTAQDNGQTWKFGCAEISKSLVKELYGVLSVKRLHGNRQALKVTIGAADFSLDTLKALVELEEENK